MLETSTDIPEQFQAGPLLAGIDDESRLTIFRALVKVYLPAGAPLLEQGKPNDRLWFVLDGGVAIERTGADERTVVLATMSGPAIYGTTTFFRGSALSATIRARSDLTVGTLDHRAHDRLRRETPRAAEGLALSVVRVLSERFDLLDVRLAELMAEHQDDHPRATEWANFCSRLFEEPAL